MPTRPVLLALLAAAAISAGGRRLVAQVPPAAVPAAAVAADPRDVASADAIVAALYDVISGPAGQKRDWDRFRSLFVPGARLIPTGMNPDKTARIRTMTPDEYATATGTRLEQSGFFEREIARTAETFGRPRNDDAPVPRSLYASAMVDFAGTDATLVAIVQRLVPCVAPELILLFGSRAAGTARGDSDYDLMLVLREPAAAVERSRDAAHDALSGLGISVDVLACSVEQYERRQHDPGYLSWLIAREGHVLYTTGAVPQRSSPPGDRVREEHEGEGLADWIRRAESDIKVAELALAAAEPSWDAICFHSHACVEKLLKALIVTQGVFPPRTHELPELLALQSPEIRDAAPLYAACNLLTKLYPKSRYPEAGYPTPDEARSAIVAAREARRVLGAKLERWNASHT